jgi:cell division protein ZapD
VIVYEFPLNEHVRTLLKLERLFQQTLQLIKQDTPLSHHTALTTLFGLMEISARNEVKTDLQMDLTRLRQQLCTSSECQQSLPLHQDGIIQQIDRTLTALQALPARIDQVLREREWLGAIKQRANIPGGINEFDVPYYHYWQHLPAAQRRADLVSWLAPILPIYHALDLILQHLRESGQAQALLAEQGLYQQMLIGRHGHLLRIGLASDEAVIPETSANRHAIHIRFLSFASPTPTRCAYNVEFQLCFCSS